MRQIRLLDPDAVPDTLVIKAHTVEACVTAERIVDDARTWAKAHMDEARTAIRQAELEATERGYAEGLRQFQSAADDYAQAREALAAQVEDLLAKCLLRVFGEYPARDVLRHTVVPVLNTMVPGDDLSIAVHPDQASDLDTVLAEHARQTGSHRSIDIEPHPDMAPGDCVIYSPSEVIHAGIHVLTEQLLSAISDLRDETAPPDPAPDMTGGDHG